MKSDAMDHEVKQEVLTDSDDYDVVKKVPDNVNKINFCQTDVAVESKNDEVDNKISKEEFLLGSNKDCLKPMQREDELKGAVGEDFMDELRECMNDKCKEDQTKDNKEELKGVPNIWKT